MRIHPERSGREPGQEALPRTEITEAARKVAGVLSDIEYPHALRVFLGGTRVKWTDYGTFSIDVRDFEAPPSIRGRTFYADFEAEHFHYGESLHGSPAKKALRVVGYLDPVGGKKRREQEAQNRLPIPDYVAEELARYLRPPETQ